MVKSPTREKVRAAANMEKPDEYTERDKKSSSAPVEILTEFLTSLMLKDYEKSLEHCSQILTHEPKNSIAEEFYPLLQKKLKMIKSEALDNASDSDDSTYSASDSDNSTDSGSLRRDTDGMKSSSSSSESDSSLEEADDEQSLGLQTSPFGCLNFNTTQTERANVKKQARLPSTSQKKKKNNLKSPSNKEL